MAREDQSGDWAGRLSPSLDEIESIAIEALAHLPQEFRALCGDIIIQIADFPVRSSYVWAPMGSMFNNRLKDEYASHTKLEQVKRNGDLKIEGEIIRYEQRNKAVSAEGYSASTELSITVNVRFTNNTNHAEDFEQQFTAQESYDSTLSLNSVQEELVGKMFDAIIDQIFNATVANW